MKTILCMLVLAVASPSFAQPGSAGSAAGSGSAAPAAGSGAGSGSAAPAAGSGSAAGAGSASAGSSDPGAGSATPPPAPPVDEPTPGAHKACVAAMNIDPNFADRVIKTAELRLQDKMNSEQVLKDLCTVRMHQESQDEVATNKRHVLLAYLAMWLVAAGFVLYLWRKQQALKREIVLLRNDLDAATKDPK